MNKSAKLIADSLQRVQLQAHDGIVQSSAMSRVDRERLLRVGWLQPVIRGWYILAMESSTSPLNIDQGSSVLWFGHFWDFVRIYLEQRFNDEYCLSSEISLDIHTGTTVIPAQIIIMVKETTSSQLVLPHDTSMLIYPEISYYPDEIVKVKQLNLMSLAQALCRVAPRYFTANPLNAELALRLVQPDDLSRVLLEGGHSRAASRLMGAYQFLNETARANRIKDDMLTLGYKISPTNPFEIKLPILESGVRITSPVAGRIKALWKSMREDVIQLFPAEPGIPVNANEWVRKLDDIYQHDAYNSLSIEGYSVTPELIQKIARGEWNPENNLQDYEQKGAMAARGYLEAYRIVSHNILQILQGAEPFRVVEQNLHAWYRALFSASVQAGIINTSDLAGFRNRPVYITGSKHVPPASEALPDCIETLIDLLKHEPSAAVRAVLGHFIFVYIHPYIDGNGRMGRFLMNTMLSSAGYNWTIIRLERRKQYMEALEQASCHENIKPFTELVIQEMTVDWRKQG